ncbi:hypothetical protein HK103_005459 [Boothiomyces macroporosus]|uniref:Uncharacterized protein n=1 Tax=Boothiomyces macroporosus TaxID=261099 RepID=A0AAD5Y3B3_9FUNG|nr:hypothetical protein HK103_005459 [Boothiomyces macroporosus]
MSKPNSVVEKKLNTKNALEKTIKIYLDGEPKKKSSVVDRLSAPKTLSKPTSAYISRKSTMSAMAGSSRPTSRNVMNSLQDKNKYRDSRPRKYETTSEKNSKLSTSEKKSTSVTLRPPANPNEKKPEQLQLDRTDKTISKKDKSIKEASQLETQKRAQSPRSHQQTESFETPEKKQSRPKSALSHWQTAENTPLVKDDSFKNEKSFKQEPRTSVGNNLRPSSANLQRPNSFSNRPNSGSKRPTSPRKSPPLEEPKPEDTELQTEATNELIISLQNRIARLEEQNAKLLKERDRLTRDLDNHIKANVGERTNVDHLKAQFTEQHAQNASLIVHNRSLKTQVYELEALIETLLQTAPPETAQQIRSNLKQFG